jgi:hypothetical protein
MMEKILRLRAAIAVIEDRKSSLFINVVIG